jgi:hypothetical protein
MERTEATETDGSMATEPSVSCSLVFARRTRGVLNLPSRVAQAERTGRPERLSRRSLSQACTACRCFAVSSMSP